MNPSDYVENAIKTESVDFEAISKRIGNPQSIRLLHAAMGMETEVGEFMDQLKKHVFYGKPIDYVNLGEELGDMLWYVAIASDVLEGITGISLPEWMERNIDKLKARYPDKFSSEHAIQRDLDAERKILEGSGG